jgi:MoaA/NifB/PqqE/SkfB family radical SAM enzyme
MPVDRRKNRMATAAPVTPRRYFEAVGEERSPVAEAPPVCVYFEVTNRCNLLCETCPRTFEALEPPADMSWELFTSIVEQVPGLKRAVLHGVGEPMMVKKLPRMIRHLKQRGVYVLFNTNGTLLAARKRQDLIDSGLDELRVSLDAAEPASFLQVRGKNFFERIVRNVREFIALQQELGAASPRVSLWLTGLRETIAQLPDFVRLAARIGVAEVYLQRLVFDDLGRGLAREQSSLFERTRQEEDIAIAEAQALGRTLGVTIDASGATEPEASLQRAREHTPWSACRRPWSLMYFTAHGRALPCCIAPFSARGYASYTLGDATRETLREIWNGSAYREFRAALLSDAPSAPCRNCGLRWSL